MGGTSQSETEHPGECNAGGDASECQRDAVRSGAFAPFNDRVRCRLQPRANSVDQTGPRTGVPVITGVDMFVRQAALQFKLFTGVDAPIGLMRKQVKRLIGAARF